MTSSLERPKPQLPPDSAAVLGKHACDGVDVAFGAMGIVDFRLKVIALANHRGEELGTAPNSEAHSIGGRRAGVVVRAKNDFGR